MTHEERKQIFASVWNAESKEINRLIWSVDYDKASDLIELILETKRNGGRIFLAGVGTSAAAARKIAHSFCCVEIPSFFLSPGDAVHGGLGAVQPGDVAVLISKGGNTREIVNIIAGIKAKNATLVGVTENEDSALAQHSDLLIKIKVEREPDKFNMLATASTLAVIAFFDAIAICLMHETGYTKEQFAIIHPGGAVGERLLKEKK